MKKIIKISILSAILFFIFLIPAAFADTLGTSKTFNVDAVYDSMGKTQVVATLRRISEKAYFYIEDNWWNPLGAHERSQAENKIQALANEFDKVIYPKLTEFFGEVREPGINNDPIITILMTRLKQNAGGYFDSCHQYSSSQCRYSNEREMIHVNVDFLSDRKMKDFIAHELQHLISWNQKERLTGLNEDIWLNEMRSEYAASLLSYNEPYLGSLLETRIAIFLNNYSDPLGEWGGETGDYGVIATLGQYLVNQYGENIFSLISKNSLVGINSINKAVKSAGYFEDFGEIFTNWSLANYYNNLAIGRGGKYGYTAPNLKRIHVPATINSFYSYSMVSFSERVKDWSPRWYSLQNKFSTQDSSIALKIEFESSNQTSNFKVPYVINYKNGSYDLGFINLENQKGLVYIFNFAKGVSSVLVIPANHSKTTSFTNNDPSVLFTLKASTVIIDQPVISSISPAYGPLLGGNTITIKGGNFRKGIEVYFGGTKSPNVTLINDTALSAMVPSHEPGAVNVWIKNPDGKSNVFAQGYKYERDAINNGSLIRAKGDYKVYIIQEGYKRHVLDSRIFGFYGHLNWASIIEVTPEERDSYKTIAWVRTGGDSKVYEVNDDRTKHWLNMTAEQFVASGRSWGGVFVINKQEGDFYRTGANVLYR